MSCFDGGPIIVSGLPRSGTSLIMQMLGAGGVSLLCDSSRDADASNPRGYFECARVKNLGADNEWLLGLGDCAIKIVSPLLRHIPAGLQAHCIFIERNMKEILCSQAEMLLRSGRARPSLEEDLELSLAYHRHLVDVFQDLERRDKISLLRIQHAHVIANPLEAARMISTFVQRPLEVSAMAQCMDRSLYRSRNES